MIVAWFVIIIGSFLFIDGFLPLRSKGPTPSWVEVAMGTGGLGVGLVLKWIAGRLNKCKT